MVPPVKKDKLENTFIPHIKSQVCAANLILFTGAGFSLGAKNILGETPPLAEDLKPLYWNLCYGDDNYDDGSSLSDIYDACLNRNPNALKEKTLEKLTILAGSLDKWYNLYFQLPWLSAYTLNIDNIEVVASNQFQLFRKWVGISATSEFTTELNLANLDSLQLVHLNGCLEDLPEKVTFSTIQYAERTNDPNPWTLRLSNDLLSRSVIFVGTDLNEPFLWSFLSLRGKRGERGLRELRPRSYLVTPNLPRPRQSLLSQFNIEHIPMTAEEFAHEVLLKISTEDITEGCNEIRRRYVSGKSASRPIDLKTVDLNPSIKTEFLMGQEPVWSDITSGRAIETEFDENLAATVRKQLAKSRPCHILVSGPAGSGKTTSLMRIALSLNAEGKHVFWIDRDTEIGPGKILDFLSAENEIDVLVIDDSDMYGQQLSNLLYGLSTAESYPLILFEMRSHFIDRCLIDSLLKGIKPIELVVPKLTDRDIRRLIDSLDRENRLGNLKGKQLNEQIFAFRENANRELIVAMYEATTGLKFREKIVDELTQLEDPAKSIYVLAAVANFRRFNLSKDEIILAIGDFNNTIPNEIERLFQRRLLAHPRNESTLYMCRHRVISDFVFSAAHQLGILYPIVFGLLRMAALKSTSELSLSAKPKRLLRTFINHELVYSILGLNQTQTLYAELESFLSQSHHFWLHRGSIEVEHGSVGHAENYLSQARGLATTDPLVKNEWAYLLFKKAINIPGALEAPGWAQEAEDILIELIYENKAHPHPYHVLGSQGLIWCRVGIREIKKQANYLQRIEKHLQRGVVEFPSNNKIREIAHTVKQEYLNTAVG